MFKENLFFDTAQIETIRNSLRKGNDVLIRPKRDEIQIIEQKTKIIGRADKKELLEKSDK